MVKSILESFDAFGASIIVLSLGAGFEHVLGAILVETFREELFHTLAVPGLVTFQALSLEEPHQVWIFLCHVHLHTMGVFSGEEAKFVGFLRHELSKIIVGIDPLVHGVVYVVVQLHHLDAGVDQVVHLEVKLFVHVVVVFQNLLDDSLLLDCVHPLDFSFSMLNAQHPVKFDFSILEKVLLQLINFVILFLFLE